MLSDFQKDMTREHVTAKAQGCTDDANTLKYNGVEFANRLGATVDEIMEILYSLRLPSTFEEVNEILRRINRGH